jgi:hypothetical protein
MPETIQDAFSKGMLASAVGSMLLSPIYVQPRALTIPQTDRESEVVEFVLAISAHKRPLFDQRIAVSILESKVNKADLESRLRRQADKWERETAHLSSPLQRMAHPSYQAILGISAESAEQKRRVIRFLLHDMSQNRRDWLLTLSYLTQENPIDLKDSGKTDKMIGSWMEWGKKNRLL